MFIVHLQTAVAQTVTNVCVQTFEQSGVSNPLQMELNVICCPELGYPENELNVEGNLMWKETSFSRNTLSALRLVVKLLSAVSTELGGWCLPLLLELGPGLISPWM